MAIHEGKQFIIITKSLQVQRKLQSFLKKQKKENT